MFLPFVTSAMILAWFLALSALVVRGAVFWQGRRRAWPSGHPWHAVVPGIVLCPPLVALAHRWWGVDLIFPVRLLSDGWHMATAAVVPAILLLVITGFCVKAWHGARQEWRSWSAKQFPRTIAAFGGDPTAAMRPFLFRHLLWALWQQTLPLLFGELIIVEVVFNAPGLGAEAFQRARARDVTGMAWALLLLFGLYAAVNLWRHRQQMRLGERLAGYDG